MVSILAFLPATVTVGDNRTEDEEVVSTVLEGCGTVDNRAAVATDVVGLAGTPGRTRGSYREGGFCPAISVRLRAVAARG